MREDHAEQEHRAVLQSLPRLPRPRDVRQRYRQRSQSDRVEAKRQPGKESDPHRHPLPVGEDLRQRIRVHVWEDPTTRAAAGPVWAVMKRPGAH